MNNIKQVIVMRKDLKLHKSKMASLASRAAFKFLIENNESKRGDELFVKLSPEEVQWLQNSLGPVVVGVDSQEALDDLIFKAEMSGMNVHTVLGPSTKPDSGSILLCAAFGPDDEELINRITGNLKLI